MASLLERVSLSVAQAQTLGNPSDPRNFCSLEYCARFAGVGWKDVITMTELAEDSAYSCERCRRCFPHFGLSGEGAVSLRTVLRWDRHVN
jgi:hypothetical protein